MYTFKEILKQWKKHWGALSLVFSVCAMKWHYSVQHTSPKNRPIVSFSVRGKIKDWWNCILNVHHYSKLANINEVNVFRLCSRYISRKSSLSDVIYKILIIAQCRPYFHPNITSFRPSEPLDFPNLLYVSLGVRKIEVLL